MTPHGPPTTIPTADAGQASGMNRYGHQAMQHWTLHLPGRFARIANPIQFFTAMGREIADEIAELSGQAAAQHPAEATYLAEVGRLNRLRLQSEEQVLDERIFRQTDTP